MKAQSLGWESALPWPTDAGEAAQNEGGRESTRKKPQLTPRGPCDPGPDDADAFDRGQGGVAHDGRSHLTQTPGEAMTYVRKNVGKK